MNEHSVKTFLKTISDLFENHLKLIQHFKKLGIIIYIFKKISKASNTRKFLLFLGLMDSERNMQK